MLYPSVSRKRKILPPGPTGFPIVGYYPFLRKDPLKAINKLWKKYGNIFGFYMGSQYVVVPNDWKIATELFNKAINRPEEVFKNVPHDFGIAGKNGPIWVESRHMVFKAMKEIGLYQARWEYDAQKGAKCIVERLLQHGEGPLDVKTFFYETFMSNILSLVFGQSIIPGSEVSLTLVKSVGTILEQTKTMLLSNFSPTIAKILQLLSIEQKITLEKELRELNRIVSCIVEKKISNPDNGDKSFVGQINQEIQQRRKHLELGDNFKDDAIKGNAVAFITGGSERPRAAFIWLLIAMAENLHVQKKVHEELDKVLGKDGVIFWAQRMDLPYTVAVILEVLRWKTLVPHPALRVTTEDLEIEGYFIPKGTYIVINTWALHNDPRHWKDPERFTPERFLSDDGKNVKMAPASYSPFSAGKRNCPGKPVALMELLQYFSIIMQKFKVLPKDGKKVKYDTTLGLMYQPTNVELCFSLRR